jgi:hypothetical protein
VRILALLAALIGTLLATRALAGEAFEVTVLRGGNITVVSGDERGEISERVIRESPDPPPAPPDPEPREEPEAPPVVVKVVLPATSYNWVGGWPVVYFGRGSGRPDHSGPHGFDRHRRFGRGVMARPGAYKVGGHGGNHRSFGRGVMASRGAHGIGIHGRR